MNIKELEIEMTLTCQKYLDMAPQLRGSDEERLVKESMTCEINLLLEQFFKSLNLDKKDIAKINEGEISGEN